VGSGQSCASADGVRPAATAHGGGGRPSRARARPGAARRCTMHRAPRPTSPPPRSHHTPQPRLTDLVRRGIQRRRRRPRPVAPRGAELDDHVLLHAARGVHVSIIILGRRRAALVVVVVVRGARGAGWGWGACRALGLGGAGRAARGRALAGGVRHRTGWGGARQARGRCGRGSGDARAAARAAARPAHSPFDHTQPPPRARCARRRARGGRGEPRGLRRAARLASCSPLTPPPRAL